METSGESGGGAVQPPSQKAGREFVWRYPQTEGGGFELIAESAVIGWMRFDDRAEARSVGEF
jgi:hypothetical protein